MLVRFPTEFAAAPGSRRILVSNDSRPPLNFAPAVTFYTGTVSYRCRFQPTLLHLRYVALPLQNESQSHYGNLHTSSTSIGTTAAIITPAGTNVTDSRTEAEVTIVVYSASYLGKLTCNGTHSR